MHILGPIKAKVKMARKVKAKGARRAKAKGVKIVVRVQAENLASQANPANQAKAVRLLVPKAKTADRLQPNLVALEVHINPIGLIALQALVGTIRERVTNQSSRQKPFAGFI